MKMIYKILLTIVLVLVIFVGGLLLRHKLLTDKLVAESINIHDGEEKRIILVNGGKRNRQELAALVDSIGSLNPKVIGLKYLFAKHAVGSEDSLLLESLISNKPVVLQAKHQGIGYYGVHKKIAEKAAAIGYFEPNQEEAIWPISFSFLDSFYLYRERNKSAQYSMAYQLAKIYDSGKADSYLKNHKDQPQKLLITKLPKQFKTVKYADQLDSANTLGKIVLIGSLGPGDQDKFITWTQLVISTEDGSFEAEYGEPDMYGIEIIANQILMILDSKEQ